MRSISDVLNLVICLMLSNCNAVTIYFESGKSGIINPNIQGKPEDILWKFNGNKLAEQDLADFQDYGQFKGRLGIEIRTGQLTVRNMSSHDSGVYECEIQIGGKLQTSKHEVEVIDAVQQPNVSCKLNKTSELKTLICSQPSRSQTVSYEWTKPNYAQVIGQELQISKDEKPESVYICTVRNPVSQKNTSITLKACNRDKPYQNIILHIILAVICVVIVCIGAFLCIRQRKKDLRRSGVNTEDDRDEAFEGSLMHISKTRKTSNTYHADKEDNGLISPVKIGAQDSNEDDDDDDDDADRKKDNRSAKKSEERKLETDDDDDDDDDKNDGPEKSDPENIAETSGGADEPTNAGGDADADEPGINDGGSIDGPED